MSPIIQLQQVSKIYKTGDTVLAALKEVDLSIDQGELVAIVGASGSGKSTLLNILGLLDRPSQGAYYLNGQLVEKLSDDELAQTRNQYIGFVFQSFFLLPRLNAYQNVMLPLIYRGLDRESAKAKVLSLLDYFGISHLAHHRPQQLSGGQQQRVAIARALVGDPNIILADEPTGALDSHTSQEVMNLLLELNQKQHKTVIIVTHALEIARQCHRLIQVQDGQIIKDERSSP